MRRFLTAATLAMLATGCTYSEQPETAAQGTLPDLAAARDNPRLALMSHMLGDYFAQDVPLRPTVCASAIDGRNQEAFAQDDEVKLIERYEALAPFSRCAYIDDAWQDSDTGERAIVFSLHNFTCSSATRCTGFGGYTMGVTSSMTYRYTMDYTGGRWTVERDPMLLAE